MKTLTRALCVSLTFTAPALADVDLGEMIADRGLFQTIEDLEAMPTRSPSDDFALAASHFLRGIERNFQTRYHYDLTEDVLDIPGLSIGIHENPMPAPFDPVVINRIFEDLQADMLASRAALPVAEDVAILLSPDDIWFDINVNGVRDNGEGFVQTAIVAVVGQREFHDLQINSEKPEHEMASIRFDASDVHWLRAYTHLLSGTADLVLSFDPTPAIEQVMGADMRMFGDQTTPSNGFLSDESVNLLAIIVTVLGTQPDAERTRTAQGHFLAMLDANEDFWTSVAAETDNTAEWVPNPRQTAALPIDMGPEIGEGWQAVLAEARAILTGEVLLPHPRLNRLPAEEQSHGLDLAAWLQDPAPIDLVGFLHGHGIEPYFREGVVADFAATRHFGEMTGRNFVLFSLFLN